MMGLNQSTIPDFEDLAEDYDAMNKIRNDVFSDKHSNEEWRQILRDFVSGFGVFSFPLC